MLSDHELKTVCFSVGFFALGAVALILYQHSKHSQAIVGALAAAPSVAQQGSASAIPVAAGSLAGAPTIGQQQGDTPFQQTTPLTVGPNYTVNGLGRF